MAIASAQLRRPRRLLQNWLPYILVGSLLIFGLATLCRANYPSTVQESIQVDAELISRITALSEGGGDWNRFAYVQYVVSAEEVCKAVMIFSELAESRSLAQRVLYYPSNWKLNDDSNTDPKTEAVSRLLRESATEFGVILRPTNLLSDTNVDYLEVTGEFRKYRAFGLTQYERVIVLDTDSILLQSMDELFYLPPAPLAMPWVYVHEYSTWGFSSKLLVIQPSLPNLQLISRKLRSSDPSKITEGLIVELFERSCIELPQRPYHLISAEFRQLRHESFLVGMERWDAEKARVRARFVSLYDPPLSAPWNVSAEDLMPMLPKCGPAIMSPGGYRKKIPMPDCRNRNMWTKLYSDFRNRRRIVCGEGFF